MATNEEIAWAAGLFEGEGCALVYHDKRGISEAGSFKPVVTLSMTDKDTVYKFRDIIGFGQIVTSQRKKWKRQWRWQSSSKIDVPKIGVLLPWLSDRRTEQVQKAIKSCVLANKTETSKNAIEKMNLKIHFCDLCGKGPMSIGPLTLHRGKKKCMNNIELHERVWS